MSHKYEVTSISKSKNHHYSQILHQTKPNKIQTVATCTMEGPTCSEVIAKASLELLGLLVLILPMAYVYVFTSDYEPYHRGFFCDDQNLKHPYHQQQVPIVQCVIIWGVVATCIIVLVETLRSYACSHTRRKRPISNNCTPWIIVELYRHFGFFTLGALTTLLFTELAKYTIGRLRPHYLTVCGPRLTPELCLDEFGYQKFVLVDEENMCESVKDGTYSKKQLQEARLSFLSGHSSFSFYCGMFLIIYLQARLNNIPRINNIFVRRFVRSMKVLRPFLQFGMIILSFWVSLTRISDYFHHPLDVIMGAIVGMTFAIITLIVIGDIFVRRSSFWKTLRIQEQQITMPDAIISERITQSTNTNLAMREPEGWLLQNK